MGDSEMDSEREEESKADKSYISTIKGISFDDYNNRTLDDELQFGQEM